jgi:hypothetical protein
MIESQNRQTVRGVKEIFLFIFEINFRTQLSSSPGQFTEKSVESRILNARQKVVGIATTVFGSIKACTKIGSGIQSRLPIKLVEKIAKVSLIKKKSMGNTILLIFLSILTVSNTWFILLAYFHINRKNNAIADAVDDISANIVKAGSHSMAHGEFNSAGIQYILIAVRLYMIANKNYAIKVESYENVKYYDDVIREIEKLIQTTTKN